MHTICSNRNVQFFEIKRVICKTRRNTPQMSWLNSEIKQIGNIVQESLDVTPITMSKSTMQGMQANQITT